MRLATFEFRGKEAWGIVLRNPHEDRLWVYEPAKVDRQLQLSATTTNGFSVSMPKFMPESKWPSTLVEFLGLEEEGMSVLRKLERFLIRFLEQSDEARMSFCGYPLEEVSLKAPIPQPRLMGDWSRTLRPLFVPMHSGRVPMSFLWDIRDRLALS